MNANETPIAVPWSHGVVVGFDGSPDSMQAFKWAVSAADRHGGRLTLVTAYATPYSMTGAVYDETDVRESVLEETREVIRGLGVARPSEIGVRARSGSPVQMLVDYSRTADLVVVGRSGVSGLDRLILGSVSSATAAMAHGPVAVVPPDARATAPERVIACVNPDDDPTAVLDFAFGEGRAGARPVTILHTVEPEQPVLAIAEGSAGTPALRQPEREEMAELLDLWSSKYTDVDRTIDIRRGPASLAVLEDLSSGDLLVFGGRRHPRAVGTLLGSVPDAALRRAPCAAVVVHSRKEQ